SPFQWQRLQSEWAVPAWQRGLAAFTTTYLPLYQVYLKQRLRQIQPQVLHAHFANVGLRYLTMAQQLDLPLVVSFYGYDYEKLPHLFPKIRLQYQRLFEQAAAIITEGPHGASMLEKMGCPAEKIRVIPLGIRPEQIPFQAQQKPVNRLRLIQAATYTEKKGHRYTLEAFYLALSDCPDLELTLVGEVVDPDLFKSIQAFVDTKGLAERVHFIDFIAPDSFHQKLQAYDVFIQPSCYAEDRDCEGGAPVALLDAQASGVPVIATTHCDIPFEVRHEQSGLLSPEKDILALAESIRRFYRMGPEEFAGFSRNARKQVETHFNVAKSGAKLASLYKEL
ncbi:MAG: glycosyltransferase, partial [Phaeodactylibacter sp.]|nr:glycosyltransferase [Phaeodactylibacter sp.]